MRNHLTQDDVVKAIEHQRPPRVPMMIHFWNYADRSQERGRKILEIQEQYPNDVFVAGARMPNYWDDIANPDHIPGYSWMNVPPPTPPKTDAPKAHDTNAAIGDWSQLDGMLAAWPDPNIPQMFAGQKEHVDKNADGRYVLFTYWFCFFERLWSLRGMESLLCDFHLNPEPVHRLMDALTDFYCVVIRRAAKEVGARGVFTSDDIGMQTGPMFSPKVFKEFFKPRYARLIKTAHEAGMHFWLHTCGDVTPFMSDFVEIGLDVIHPVQKYAMDEAKTAERFGGKIAFWFGMDVQQIMPHGTPEQVRAEVRHVIDLFDRPEGGCMITAGNAITDDIPVDNLFAFYDETYNCGLAHRRVFTGMK